MSNPLFAMLGGAQPSGLRLNPQMISSAKRMISLLGAVNNPEAALQQAAQQNPMLATALQMCQGQNPKDVFYKLCRENNIDPNKILNQLK